MVGQDVSVKSLTATATGGKTVSVPTNGQIWVDGAGTIYISYNGSVILITGASARFTSAANFDNGVLGPTNPGALLLRGTVADGNTAVAAQIGNTADLATAGAHILDLYRGNVANLQASVYNNGIYGNVTGLQGASVASGTGITTNYNGDYRFPALSITVASTAWTAAATSQDINLITLPARARIRYFYADTTVAFAGLAGTIAQTVGTSAGGTQILASKDVKTAAVTAGIADADLGGTTMNRASMIQGSYLPSFSATTTISVRLTSGTGNIGTGAATNLSAGSTTYYVGWEAL